MKLLHTVLPEEKWNKKFDLKLMQTLQELFLNESGKRFLYPLIDTITSPTKRMKLYISFKLFE